MIYDITSCDAIVYHTIMYHTMLEGFLCILYYIPYYDIRYYIMRCYSIPYYNVPYYVRRILVYSYGLWGPEQRLVLCRSSPLGPPVRLPLRGGVPLLGVDLPKAAQNGAFHRCPFKGSFKGDIGQYKGHVRLDFKGSFKGDTGPCKGRIRLGLGSISWALGFPTGP